MVPIDLRPVTPDELPAFVRANAVGFGEGNLPDDSGHAWVAHDLERTVGAFEGDDVVAGSRNYGLELTLPGGAVLPAAGVSWVSVLPTHRRQGLLRLMMSLLLDDAVERGEPVALLTASEGGIYRRFGFGVATRALGLELDRQRVRFADAEPYGSARLVDPAAAVPVVARVFDRVRRSRPGAVSRPDAWWDGGWFEPWEKDRNRFVVIHEHDGEPDAFTLYALEKDPRRTDGLYRLFVHEAVAADPRADAALWRYLCGVDLVGTVVAPAAEPDTALPWRLEDPRACRVDGWPDFVWARPLDTAALLGARRYGVEGRLVLEVHDGFRPGGRAAGRFALDGGPGGAECTACDSEPDLVLDVADLGAVVLGGVPPSVLVRAGRIEERHPGAASRADAMFGAERQPCAFTWF